MQGLQKSKRVCWASDVNSCQVRLFLSDESPAQVGFSAQEYLQAKTSTGKSSNHNSPTGFEGPHGTNLLKNKLSQIPSVQWKCPPRFALDLTWQVVAGEESEEVETQNQREMRMLEAIYPRPSAIPPNPFILVGTEDSTCNNPKIPLIPITPFEDEDTTTDISIDPMESVTINPVSNGNLIDHDLLMKILSDPKLIEKLVTDYKAPNTAQIMSVPTPPGVILSQPPPVQISQAETTLPSLAAPSSGPFYPPLNKTIPISNSHLPPGGTKDINYYKNLIQQHGGERQEKLSEFSASHHHHQLGAKQEQLYNLNSREFRYKVMKPCIYFNSSRGCRHGPNCSYQHSRPEQRPGGMMDGLGAKRMKLDRELTGL